MLCAFLWCSSVSHFVRHPYCRGSYGADRIFQCFRLFWAVDPKRPVDWSSLSELCIDYGLLSWNAHHISRVLPGCWPSPGFSADFPTSAADVVSIQLMCFFSLLRKQRLSTPPVTVPLPSCWCISLPRRCHSPVLGPVTTEKRGGQQRLSPAARLNKYSAYFPCNAVCVRACVCVSNWDTHELDSFLSRRVGCFIKP